MPHHQSELAAFLLAQVEWELDKISERQHALARRKAVLRERATRLRLGASPADLDLPAGPWASPAALMSVSQGRQTRS